MTRAATLRELQPAKPYRRVVDGPALEMPRFSTPGLCAGHPDPELWWTLPPTPGHAESARASQAKRICRRCPIRQECLDWSLRNHEWFGIWGGLNADERAALIRRHRHGRGSVVVALDPGGAR